MKLTIHCAKITPSLGERGEAFAATLPQLYLAMGQDYITFIQRNVGNEQSPDGVKWAQLSPATAKRKVNKRHERGYHPILRVSGRMTNLYCRVLGDGVHVGTNVKYAPLHQFGGRTGRNHAANVPARPWLFSRDGGVPERFKQRLERMVEREIQKCLS